MKECMWVGGGGGGWLHFNFTVMMHRRQIRAHMCSYRPSQSYVCRTERAGGLISAHLIVHTWCSCVYGALQLRTQPQSNFQRRAIAARLRVDRGGNICLHISDSVSHSFVPTPRLVPNALSAVCAARRSGGSGRREGSRSPRA